MSTHQVSKPCLAKYSIAEESGRPGTSRSNVGCDAIDEPCTNRTMPFALAGSPMHFSHMNSLAVPSLSVLVVQCSCPVILAPAVTVLTSFMSCVLSWRARGWLAAGRWVSLKDFVELAFHACCVLLDVVVIERQRLDV